MKLKNKLFAFFAFVFVLQSAHADWRGRNYGYGRPGIVRGGVIRRGAYAQPRSGVYAGPVVYSRPVAYEPDYDYAYPYYDGVYGDGVGAGVDGIVGAEVGVGNGVGAGVNVGGLGVGAGVGFW